MGLKDFFKRNKVKSVSRSEEFWTDIQLLCLNQVSKMIAYFFSIKAAKINWAEPRFRQLIETASIQSLIESAKSQLPYLDVKSVNPAKPVGIFYSWYVCVTVFPSEADALFLEKCPNKNIEDYLDGCRKEFRDFTMDWLHLDYAHWILLLDEPNSRASVHLYTQWNLEIHLHCITEGQKTGVAIMPPAIIPTELISNIYEFHERIVDADIESATLKGSYSPQSDEYKTLQQRFEATYPITKQIAKLLFMDSITSEFPIEAWNPLGYKTMIGQPINLLRQVLDLHISDCKKVNADIPLIIGVPQNFAKEVEVDLQSVEYRGLKAERVHIFNEPEVPFFQPDGSFIMSNEYQLKTYLHGGGASLAKFVETGQLSELWKQGIRWLLIGPLVNQAISINIDMLNGIMLCKKDGIMEVAKRELLPASKLLLLKQNEQLVCVDERRLKGAPQFDELRLSLQYLCTGTFWIRCEKLAEVFGINKQQLEADWNQTEWNGEFADELTKHAILCKSKNMEFGMVVPAWELFSSLELEAVQIDADRVNLISLDED